MNAFLPFHLERQPEDLRRQADVARGQRIARADGGAQLTGRESQAGVFFYKGKAVEAFGPGRHTLKTGNIPILTKIVSLPWAMQSPLRAEMYFVNLKVFTNLKWGTRNPVAFRDKELGLIRIRAHGIFNIQVVQPILFINSLVGTMGKINSYWHGNHVGFTEEVTAGVGSGRNWREAH